MVRPDPDPRSFLPLPPHVFQLVLALLEGPLHGYAIIKRIRERTEGEMDLGSSTLYTTLKRLREAGLVHEVPKPEGEETDDPRRRYYAMTELGRKVALAEAGRVRRLARQVAEAGLDGEPASSGTVS